jgi:hypothetical protein
MGFTDMLADIAKAIGAVVVLLISGRYAVEGVIMGDIAATDYVLLGVFVISMLYLFYMIQTMQSTTY